MFSETLFNLMFTETRFEFMFSETLFIFMFFETLFEFMFAATLFNFMFSGLMSFGNPPNTLIIPHKNTLIEIEPHLFLTKTAN